MVHIDYIQYSVAPDGVAIADDSTFEPFASRFYSEKASGAYGETIMRGNPNTPKWLVILSGKSCARMLSDMSQTVAIKSILDSGGVLSRIDLAHDVVYGDKHFCTVTDVLSAVRGGKMETTFGDKSCKFISGIKDVQYKSHEVETLYVGNMKKRGRTGIFRSYDKGLESGLLPNYVTRFECEWRKESAHTQAKRITEGWHLSEIIDNRVHFDTTWWYAAMNATDSGANDIMRGAAKEVDELQDAKYWAWLMQQLRSAGKRLRDMDTERMITTYNQMTDAIRDGYNDT